MKLETIVGRYFLRFLEEDEEVWSHRGVVRGNLGNGFYLVQYCDGHSHRDDEHVMEIHRIEDMVPGRWKFYETFEDMNRWCGQNAINIQRRWMREDEATSH
jgi:hypothetical protein